MLSSISGTERYQQHQTHANNLNDLHSVGQSDAKTKDEQEYSDQFSNSGIANAYKRVATNYRMEEMSFQSVIQLRQDLFDEGLISIGETNTLTLVTQTKSDNELFDLKDELQRYRDQDPHFQTQRELRHLQSVVANLFAAEAS